jgi:glycerol-1-phosphate dehydrogenase [NAD(P)+]
MLDLAAKLWYKACASTLEELHHIMDASIPVYVGDNALAQLAGFCQARDIRHTLLVADRNTYPVLGQRVEQILTANGIVVNAVVLPGQEVVPDERYIMEVLLRAGNTAWTYLAVGSGTITDITRFVSHRTRTSFISVPTAPSVDGFAAIGAPLVIANWKRTVPAQPPIAVFGDEATLRAAPRRMIASGFGDMLGKYTSLADWKLGSLVWNEPYNDAIAQRERRALESCVQQAREIGRAEGEGVCRLIEGLVESGLCMVEVGHSRPAGGSEHVLSHFWEMKLLLEGRPPIFHGAKVGVATSMVARRYQVIRDMTREEAEERLEAFGTQEREQEEARIRTGLGALGDAAVVEQEPFLALTPDDYRALKAKILDQWPAIQDVAATVPAPEKIVELLELAGGPTDTRTLGLNDEEVARAQKYAHYLRNRFGVLKLAYMLGI